MAHRLGGAGGSGPGGGGPGGSGLGGSGVGGSDAGGGRIGLATIAREWGRIGCIGFGGPPAHIALLRALCVADRG
ncbi:MAG TPA: hypothetical protein VLX31_01505, partial [Streptosporangiaceae bacterium]|nr:hypothetical protein [Streptosporangiaceae bacterium]